MKTRALLSGLALVLAACGQSPTASVAPAAPRFEGGMTLGGGLAVEPGTSTNDGAAGTASAMPATCGMEEKGGMTLGGGLYSEPAECSDPSF